MCVTKHRLCRSNTFINSARQQAARNKRRYNKACDACIACRYKQPLELQSACDANCEVCALGTTMPIVGGGGGVVGGGAPNAYGINFEAGVATVSCYDISNTATLGKCGSTMAYANTLTGIDFDAAIPLAYWPPGAGFYGNCADCGVRCSGSWGPSSVVTYDGAPLCYQITSRTTGVVKTIRVNDACGKMTRLAVGPGPAVYVMNKSQPFHFQIVVHVHTQAGIAPRRKFVLRDVRAASISSYLPYQSISPQSTHVQSGRARHERSERRVLAFMWPHHRGRVAILRLRRLE